MQSNCSERNSTAAGAARRGMRVLQRVDGRCEVSAVARVVRAKVTGVGHNDDVGRRRLRACDGDGAAVRA